MEENFKFARKQIFFKKSAKLNGASELLKTLFYFRFCKLLFSSRIT